MKETLLKNFLNSFDNNSNVLLIESIKKGYKCIFEGYESPVDLPTEDAVFTFNHNAIYNSGFGFNPVLSFLEHSHESLSSRYTADPEPELDNNMRTLYCDPIEGSNIEGSIHEHNNVDTSTNYVNNNNFLTGNDLNALK